ncbi:hypothetical protein [Desmospora activa]|uniref:Uncharacterized protein n=1 Tax=Desmospora activa DSM 45169 TaxID=1121389 RepID=A0A2T4ZDS3_9BACL|nr:hypothetical protein [Desmospora activa]PTM60034.1 hypothetical protein C8J48_2673 [Desmospora activa DSM 45169]
MDRKPRRRPWGWWKSGKTLFWIWLGGSLAIGLTSLAFLYPTDLNLKRLENQRVQAEGYLSDHQEVLAAEEEQPSAPDEDELMLMQQQIPLQPQPARLLAEIHAAVNRSGGNWVELRTESDPSKLTLLEWPTETSPQTAVDEDEQDSVEEEETRDLDETMKPDAVEEEVTEEETAPTAESSAAHPRSIEQQDLVPTLPKDSSIKPLWADLYVEASQQEMESLLYELEQLERLVAVQGWDFEEGNGERGRLRIRFAWFSYQDPRLAGLAELSPLPPLQNGEMETDEKEKRDGEDREAEITLP